ncbi:IS3 family transposase [Dietzia sp. IN118]|uniref:IS3 family transposase n=1 Tax=Dietzia sp. IN118 TaxID=3061631 RepID=UPI00293961BF|nr:IS3 family transposase [Dietzia sp. IN118]MDV3354466.1 IS3 family transposase [Dietzia sp. IN118]
MEIAVAEYIDWFNHRRIHGEIGYVPPAEYEALHAAVEPSPEPVDDLVDAR